MREYRGKSVLSIEELNDKEIPHKNGWVYGWYVDGWIVGNYADSDDEWIAFEWWSQVMPETVGQFTGLTDKNGQPIYEGDVVEITYERWRKYSVEYWGQNFGSYVLVKDGKYFESSLADYDDLEVIGNMHDKAGDDLSNYVPVEFDPMLGQSESED